VGANGTSNALETANRANEVLVEKGSRKTVKT
jgi:hypothetical protein